MRALKRIVILAAVVLAAVSLAAPAGAYELLYTNGNVVKWDGTSCTYYINSSNGPSGALSAVRSAMDTWTNAGSNFSFVYGGTTSSTAWGSNDGTNIVDFGAISTANALAVNHTWYNSLTGAISDSDIRFNTAYSWGTDGSANVYDVQNIATHELGHSLHLRDLYNASDSEKTMYGYASRGETKKRTLHSDDIAGIKAIYGESSGGGGGTSTVTAFQATFTIAQGEDAGFMVTVPSGATNLTASLTNNTGDPDLYTGDGFIPSRTNYTCRSINGSGQDDTCSHDNPTAGTWFVVVYGYTAATTTLTITYTIPSSGSAQWGVVNRVCCTNGAAIGFWGSIDDVTKGSALWSCSGSPTWEDYAQTSSGTKTLTYWTYVGCGSGPSGSESVTLEDGKCYQFRLRYTNSQFWIEQLEVSDCSAPTSAESPASGQAGVVVKAVKIPLTDDQKACLEVGGGVRERDGR